MLQQYCDPETWSDGGWYRQILDFEACPPPPEGGQDSYVRAIDVFNGVSAWFLEFRLETTGDRSDIPGGAPTVVATGNAYGMLYHATVAKDQIKLLRDVELPIAFLDLQPIPHVIRLELYNDPPATYHWYIDGKLVDEGFAEGPFPSMDSRISWRGKAWYLPTENAWDYFRYGEIPIQGSGDFDSNAVLDLFDFYFLTECLENGGPETTCGPGCKFGDMDEDGDVDMLDFMHFQTAFTGPQ
jgi:hypothetical protein